jgi:hypothetical protein
VLTLELAPCSLHRFTPMVIWNWSLNGDHSIANDMS